MSTLYSVAWVHDDICPAMTSADYMMTFAQLRCNMLPDDIAPGYDVSQLHYNKGPAVTLVCYMKAEVLL